MAYSTIGFEGANLTQALTVSSTTPEYPGAPITVGQRVIGDAGSEYVYVKVASSKSCTAGDFVVVTDHSAWTIDQLSNSTGKGKLGSRVGIAMATATAGQYLWIQIAGYTAAVNAATGATANTALHTSATAGRVAASGTGGTTAAVNGVVLLATAASNTAAAFLTGAVIGADD